MAMFSRLRRPAAPTPLGAERLECRALLAVAAGDCPPPALPSAILPLSTAPIVTGVDTTAPGCQPVVVTGAADPTPWFTFAQQSPLGSTVLRATLSPGASPGAAPTTNMQVLQTTFNAAKQSPAGAAAPPTGPATPPDPALTGVVFPGQGVPILPTDTWPKSIDAFAEPPSAVTSPQEYFVVLQSASDFMLGFTGLMLAAVTDPTFAANGGGPAGGSPDPTAGAGTGGFAGLFGASAQPGGGTSPGSTGDTGTGGSGDPASGLAMLLAFAALAGMGDGAGGPNAAPKVALTNDTGASSTDGITNDGRLEVTADPGSRLQYSTDGGRHWRRSYRVREGVNSVAVRQIDGSGSVSAATTLQFTLDRRPPPPPRVVRGGGVQPAILSEAPQISVTNPEPGATLQYSVNGGDWTAAMAGVPGRNTVRVRQVDAAGNVSRPSRAVVFRLADQAPPAVAAMNAGSAVAAVYSGGASNRRLRNLLFHEGR